MTLTPIIEAGVSRNKFVTDSLFARHGIDSHTGCKPERSKCHEQE